MGGGPWLLTRRPGNGEPVGLTERITSTPRTPGIDGGSSLTGEGELSSGSDPPGPNSRTRVVDTPALSREAPPLLATIVVMMPSAHVPMKTATTSPLTARNPALGLSASRRPAMSVAG